MKDGIGAARLSLPADICSLLFARNYATVAVDTGLKYWAGDLFVDI